MYAKNQGLRATIKYDSEDIDGPIVLITNPQAGERADMQPFGARIFYADGTQTIVPISLLTAPITTEIVDVYVKMDEESEQYVICPLDEVDAAIAFVEEQERIRAELEAAIAAENAEEEALAQSEANAELEIAGLQVIENIENPYTSDAEAQAVADAAVEGIE